MYKISNKEDYEYDYESAVIVDLKNGEFFELNEMANLILKGLIENKGFDQLKQEIMEKYDVDEEKVLKDINDFKDRLLEKGVINIQP